MTRNLTKVQDGTTEEAFVWGRVGEKAVVSGGDVQKQGIVKNEAHNKGSGVDQVASTTKKEVEHKFIV